MYKSHVAQNVWPRRIISCSLMIHVWLETFLNLKTHFFPGWMISTAVYLAAALQRNRKIQPWTWTTSCKHQSSMINRHHTERPSYIRSTEVYTHLFSQLSTQYSSMHLQTQPLILTCCDWLVGWRYAQVQDNDIWSTLLWIHNKHVTVIV